MLVHIYLSGMAKKQKQHRKSTSPRETDSAYVLKLVLYMIIGSQWLLVARNTDWQVPIPYGALVALVFAQHEHFRIDRKIEYAIILVAMFLGFWVLPGVTLLV